MAKGLLAVMIANASKRRMLPLKNYNLKKPRIFKAYKAWEEKCSFVGSNDSPTLALRNYKQLNKLQLLQHQQLSYSRFISHNGYSINIMEGGQNISSATSADPLSWKRIFITWKSFVPQGIKDLEIHTFCSFRSINFFNCNNDTRRVFWLFDIVAQKVRLCTFHRLVTWIYWQFCPGIYHHAG